MKRIAVTFDEVVRYESIIEVPDDYPETVEELEHFEPSGSGESDWWEKVEEQNPEWVTKDCMEVYERELTGVEVLERVLHPPAAGNDGGADSAELKEEESK